jgi:hypothetical protein
MHAEMADMKNNCPKRNSRYKVDAWILPMKKQPKEHDKLALVQQR